MDAFNLWWIIVIFAFFLPVEVYAAFRRAKGDTLSENVWDWFGIRKQRKYGWIRRQILAYFMIYLTGHFVWGWPGSGVVVLGIPVGFLIVLAEWEDNW